MFSCMFSCICFLFKDLAFLITLCIIWLHTDLPEVNTSDCDHIKPEAQEKLRKSLEQDNCIRELEIVPPAAVERAARLFHRDGFVVVKDALTPEQTKRLRNTCERIASEILEKDPRRIGNRGPNRYSFGSCSKTGHWLNEPDWAMLVDLPTLTPILNEIFGNDEYLLRGGGGDFTTPGSTYQSLHSDLGNTWVPDPAPTVSTNGGRINVRDLPVFYVATNFIVQNISSLNGPIRQIPMTQNSQRPIPSLNDEPLWMKRSTVCPVQEGSVIIRDPRAWHGGTPNLSDMTRYLPNIEYYASWFRYHKGQQMSLSMPKSIYDNLSEFGKKLCREILVPPDLKVDYGVKDDIIMYAGGDILPCYQHIGVTQKEIDDYAAVHNISLFKRNEFSENFYGRKNFTDNTLSQLRDEL